MSGNGSESGKTGACASCVRYSLSTASMGGWTPLRGRAAAAPPADSVATPATDGLRASRTVIRFAQVLHLTLRTFPRTLSSGIEYLVWQRSQTNFIPFVGAGGRPETNERPYHFSVMITIAATSTTMPTATAIHVAEPPVFAVMSWCTATPVGTAGSIARG